MTSERTLYLVDGTYLLFRAFHALPRSMAVTGETYLRNRAPLEEMLLAGAGSGREPAGVADSALSWLRDPARDRLPTNAARGLASVLVKLIREERPALMGVAFDLPGRVHRDDHYTSFVGAHPDLAPKLAGYKATRQPTPEEIHVQYPLARLVCGRALGIPVLEAEGFEADDLIGTLAHRARDKGLSVRLVTADKDLFQLVGEGICVLNPHRTVMGKSGGYLLMDEKVVEQEFGVPPRQVIDVLALMGDTSDNIPGVPGIGEKGAKDLIKKYGSVEAVLEAAKKEDEIARATYRNGLREHPELALFSKELATIRTDAPIDLDLDDVWTEAPDHDVLKKVFDLLAFGMLLRDVEGLATAPRPGARAGRTAAAEASAGTSAAVSSAVSAPASAPGKTAKPAQGQLSLLSWDDPPVKRAASLGPGVTAADDRAAADAERAEDDGREPGEGEDVPGVPAVLQEVAPGHESAVAVSSADAARYRAVTDLRELAALLPAMLAAPRVALDTETTSSNPMAAQLVGMSIAWEPGRAIYVPFAHRYLGAPPQPSVPETLAVLAPLLTRGKGIAGQNVKYDIEVLGRAGARPSGFDFDTMIAAFILESDRMSYGLASLAREYLADYKPPYAETAGRGAKQPAFDTVEVQRAALYSGFDADATLRLAEVLDRRLDAENLRGVFSGIDMPLLDVLVSMETTGVRIDVPLLQRLSREMGEQITVLRAEIQKLAGREFNVDSPRQLAAILFDELHLPPVSKTAKSRVASTRDEDLEILAERHPLPARVRDYRVLAKLRSTYVDALQALVNPETGRVHTSFHPTGAATGRLSSSDPNLQNIPVRTAEGRKIRAAFVPREGWSLVSADYSQIELRVMAHQSADPELIATFERGEDIHRLTASRIYNVPYAAVSGDQRRAAKTINFGILYGMGPQRLARDLGITMTEAKELIASYFGRFPTIRAYIDGTIARAERDGFVSTLFGRVRRFPELSSTSRFQRQLAVRQAVNSTIQGTAADLMKIAMVRLHRLIVERGLAARLLIQVHDELVLESPPGELPALEATIREAMEKIPPFTVPLTVDIAAGPDWLSAKP
jgi:DNA polymerase-1